MMIGYHQSPSTAQQQIEKKEIPPKFPLVSGSSEKIRGLTLTIQRIKPNIGKKKWFEQQKNRNNSENKITTLFQSVDSSAQATNY